MPQQQISTKYEDFFLKIVIYFFDLYNVTTFAICPIYCPMSKCCVVWFSSKRPPLLGLSLFSITYFNWYFLVSYGIKNSYIWYTKKCLIENLILENCITIRFAESLE